MKSYNVFQFITQICKESYMQPKVAETKMRKNYGMMAVKVNCSTFLMVDLQKNWGVLFQGD